MQPATRDWLAGLREFAAEHRLRKPLATPADHAEAAAQRMILAAWLAAWLAGSEASLAARRREAGQGGRLDPEPAVVITTSAVGAAVADELLTSGSPLARLMAERAVSVSELEYRLWCIRHPDEDHARHVNVWNWIKTSVPPQRQGEFARHPLAAGEAYWLHRAGVASGGSGERRECHLWKWNGRHAALLEAFVAERGVTDLR